MLPSASGTLGATPLAHALIYSRNRRLTGRLELAGAQGRAAVILSRGAIVAVETTPPGLCPNGFFGAVAYELGMIDAPTLDATLLEIAKTKRLHGEVLIERGAMTAEQRVRVLAEQIHRKVHLLLSFDDATTYAFFDLAQPPTPPIVAVDAVGPVWRGLKDRPPVRFVEDTTRRIADHVLRVVADGSVRLPPAETALIDALAVRPMTLTELRAKAQLPPGQADLLMYLLVIARCVEAVSGARTHPSTGALPTAMPSGPRPAASGSGTLAAARRGSSGSMPVARPVRPPPGSLAALQSPAEVGAEELVLRSQTVDEETHFEVLGVADGASDEAVRAAFLRLAKTWHPDRLVPELKAVQREVARIFVKMTEAQRTLTEPNARKAYVAELAAKRAPRPRAETMAEVERALERRDFDAVTKLTERLTGQGTDDAEALALEAWASIRACDVPREALEAALPRLDRAITVDRKCTRPIFYRGMVHKQLGNVMTAFKDFARVIQLDPTHAEAEREVRLFAMRARKGSGEHKLVAPILDKLNEKKPV